MRLEAVRIALPAIAAPPVAIGTDGEERGRRQRYTARLPLRRRPEKAREEPVAAPLSCWHVWITDGLVVDPGSDPQSDAFDEVFAQAGAIAAERAAAYRAHALAVDEAPGPGLRLDLRA